MLRFQERERCETVESMIPVHYAGWVTAASAVWCKRVELIKEYDTWRRSPCTTEHWANIHTATFRYAVCLVIGDVLNRRLALFGQYKQLFQLYIISYQKFIVRPLPSGPSPQVHYRVSQMLKSGNNISVCGSHLSTCGWIRIGIFAKLPTRT